MSTRRLRLVDATTLGVALEVYPHHTVSRLLVLDVVDTDGRHPFVLDASTTVSLTWALTDWLATQ